jgi:hypothetical protein
MDLNGFAEQIIDDDLTVARAGILVDHPAVAANTTVAQAEANNIRPFMKHYAAEAIFNWKVEGRKNAQVTTQVRLWEYVEIPGKDEFDVELQKQIRVLDLGGPGGSYRQRIFIKVKFPTGREEWVQKGLDIIPLKNGVPLSEIPWFWVGVKNGSATVEKPPLIDLANVNLSHYKSTADLEHGAHFTGLPTAVITGYVEDEKEEGEFRIGSQSAWVFPDPEAEAKFLEFEGTGLDALEKRCAKKEEYMAFLGARMLTPEKKDAETAETAQIHRSGETSVLSSLAQSAGHSIEKALKFMCEWAGFGGEVSFKFNNDFLIAGLDAPRLIALLQLWQGRAIAFDDLLENLKRGEIVRDDRTAEDIKSEVEQENPMLDSDLIPNPDDPPPGV